MGFKSKKGHILLGEYICLPRTIMKNQLFLWQLTPVELVSILEPIQLENQIFFGLVFSDKCVVLCVCV